MSFAMDVMEAGEGSNVSLPGQFSTSSQGRAQRTSRVGIQFVGGGEEAIEHHQQSRHERAGPEPRLRSPCQTHGEREK
jgi:hypothetical protein